MTKQEAGKLGGKSTFMKYGSEYMRQLGRLGGRPRLPTLAELSGSRAPEVPNLKGGNGLPGGLKELKELFKKRYGEGSAGFGKGVLAAFPRVN